jgi:hypothetical protein
MCRQLTMLYFRCGGLNVSQRKRKLVNEVFGLGGTVGPLRGAAPF